MSSSPSLGVLQALAECPFCFEVPRDLRFFICLDGHNICGKCKAQATYCPLAQCDYSRPPIPNFALKTMIENLPIQFNCLHPDCSFRQLRGEIEAHEVECEHRLIPCPEGGCTDRIPFKDIFSHIQARHKNAVVSPAGVHSYVWEWSNGRDAIDNWFWVLRCERYTEGWAFPTAHYADGLMHIWMTMLANRNEVKRLRCEIRMSCVGNELTFDTPVYPVDMSREEIMADDDCVQLNLRTLRKFLTVNERATGAEERSAKFAVAFKLVVKKHSV